MAISQIGTNAIQDGSVTATDLASGAALSNIGTGGLTATYLGSGAAVSNIGYTPANAANITTGTINSAPISNIDFSTSTDTTINSTYYKWDLPAAGNYLIMCTLRARLWAVNGFGRIRLYNNTAGAVVANSTVMLIESGSNSNTLNLCATPVWTFTATVPTTLYLQGYATASPIGIQSDSNGYNNFTWLRIS